MKKFSILLVIFTILAIGSIGMLSCISTSRSNVQTTFPYPFEGIVQAGIEMVDQVSGQL